MVKPTEQGVLEDSSQILVTLEDLTSLSGKALSQNVYIIIFGYNLELNSATVVGTGDSIEKEAFKIQKNLTTGSKIFHPDYIDIEIGNFTGAFVKKFNVSENTVQYKNESKDFFFCKRTSLKQLQRGRPYQFLNGLPLFYGQPLRRASVFVAVLEEGKSSEKENDLEKVWENFNPKLKTRKGNVLTDGNAKTKAAEAIEALQEIHFEINEIRQLEIGRNAEVVYRESLINNRFDKVKEFFSFFIKQIELHALDNNHQIRYTNVMTFSKDDEWLEGGHKDWGNQRMAMTVNVEVAR